MPKESGVRFLGGSGALPSGSGILPGGGSGDLAGSGVLGGGSGLLLAAAAGGVLDSRGAPTRCRMFRWAILVASAHTPLQSETKK
jgi:hypothetical protein